MKKSIYLDHNANTPVDPQVADVVSAYLKVGVGNPFSIHKFGRQSRSYLTRARDSISQYFKVRPDEIIFTSGGTEAANMVIRGLFDEHKEGHIITSTVEHSCVFSTVKLMEKRGATATYLEPGSWGAPTPEAVKEALRPDTRLISIMAINNETGIKTDVEGIAKVAQEADIPFFVDAVAILGKEEIVIHEGISAMAFSGQKIHATTGVGFCYIRKQLKLSPIMTGGGHQYGRRAGTENIPGIVGLAEAVKLISEKLPGATDHMRELRDLFEQELQNQIPEILVNGEGPRGVNTSNLSFKGVDGELLLSKLDLEGVAASHGSACTSGALEPSRVLVNMGLPIDRVRSSIRFSVCRDTTREEILAATAIITKIVKELRALSSG